MYSTCIQLTHKYLKGLASYQFYLKMFTFQLSFAKMCALVVLLATCYSMSSAHPLSNGGLVVSDSDLISSYKALESVPLPVLDQVVSASGYGGGGGYGHGSGSIIGRILGVITGDVLRQVLRSLTGFGVKLGMNLNNEFYNAPEYGRGYGAGSYGHGGGNYGHGGEGYGHGGGNYGHGGGGYANGYSNVQETIAKKADARPAINNNNNLRNY